MTFLRNNNGSTFLNTSISFFVYIPGETRIKFVFNAILAAIRGEGKVAVASSAIASQLLKGGTTAHGRFGIPLSLNQHSLCKCSDKTNSGKKVGFNRDMG
jgi:ATP-dependent DNA helicase PIF1